MKKKTRNIILITIGILIALFFYGKHNLLSDKQQFGKIITLAANGNLKKSFDKMEKVEGFSNPIINIVYKRWKKKMHTRFMTEEEVIKNTSDNKIINDISTIYRKYWKITLLKEKAENRTDTTLYNELTNYLITNKLTMLSKDSLRAVIKNDVEIKKIIEEQGFYADFKYRNGFQEVFIWDKQVNEKYKVILPKDTISTTVVFMENFHLNGYDYYATTGDSQVGGWAIKESATLYCNKDSYTLNSETYKISYLKHESIHFTDLNEYPNLSSTDLEYRAKIIELMYCTEKTVYDRIAEFLNGASSKERTHSHPYANHSLIKNMSKLLFDSDYESDYNKWKNTSVEKINDAAKQLYNVSEEELLKDKNVSEII